MPGINTRVGIKRPFVSNRGQSWAAKSIQLKASSVSSVQIDLTSIYSGTDEGGYSWERSLNGISGWSEIATTGNGVKTYSDMNRTPNTLYYYRVRAFKGSKYSSYSNIDVAISFTSESDALISRMTAAGETPNATREAIIRGRIKQLLDNSLWSHFDAIYLEAAHGTLSSRMNIIQNAYNLVNGSAPSFTADDGHTGNGSSMYLKTGISPVAGGFKYTLDSASLFFHTKTSAANTTVIIGAMGASAVGKSIIFPRYSGTNACYVNINGGSDSTITGITDGSGWWAIVRDSHTAFSVYHNKTRYQFTITANGLPPEIYILTYNNNGSIASFDSRQLSMVGIGEKFTETENGKLYDILVDGYLADLPSLGNITFLGDSITAGSGASDFAHQFSTIVSTTKTCRQTNLGVASRGMTKCGTTPPYPWISLMNTQTPQKYNSDKYIVYMFGLNDAFYYAGVEQFTTDYTASLNKALAMGWNVSSIILSTMPYTTYPVLSLECPPYNQAIKNIGASFGITVVDTWQYMADHGGQSLLSGDNLHPNDSGHAAIATALLSVM